MGYLNTYSAGSTTNSFRVYLTDYGKSVMVGGNNLISAITKSSLNGITAQATKAKVIVTIGAKMKITLLELEGIIISLKMYFKASAKDWNKPNGPTTFGPLLFWTKAHTLLSNQTISATATKIGTSKNKIL